MNDALLKRIRELEAETKQAIDAHKQAMDQLSCVSPLVPGPRSAGTIRGVGA